MDNTVSPSNAAAFVAGDAVGFRAVDGACMPFRYIGVEEGFILLGPVAAGQPVVAIDERMFAELVRPASECEFFQACEACTGTGMARGRYSFEPCAHCHGRRMIPYEPFANEPTI